ncbi:hypothetical protein LX36DRAFT_348651 [Colletotrichum falcatum]|nr:hypothetical protein LX36DRAFT_348651 [Colletotrichum falcatum]
MDDAQLACREHGFGGCTDNLGGVRPLRLADTLSFSFAQTSFPSGLFLRLLSEPNRQPPLVRSSFPSCFSASRGPNHGWGGRWYRGVPESRISGRGATSFTTKSLPFLEVERGCCAASVAFSFFLFFFLGWRRKRLGQRAVRKKG